MTRAEITEPERSLLFDLASRLARWSYSDLRMLAESPYIEERKTTAGTWVSIRAEVQEEIDEGDYKKLTIPIELRRGKNVHWIHLYADSTGRAVIDRTICTNPIV